METTSTGVSFPKNIDVDGHTDLDNVSVSGVTTFSDDVTFTGANYDLQWDKSDDSLEFADNTFAVFGGQGDLKIRHNTTVSPHVSQITNAVSSQLEIISDNLELRSGTSDRSYLTANVGAATTIFHSHTKRFETTTDGVKITGGLQDKDGELGTSGQVLSSTGTELNWVAATSGQKGQKGEVGTTTKGQKGEVGATGTGTGTADKIFENDTSVECVDTGTGVVEVKVDGTETITVKQGEVGINVTDPKATLDVARTSDNYPAINVSGGNNTYGDLTVESGEILQTGHWNRSTGTFTERFRIGTKGALGIGGGNYGSSGQVLTSKGGDYPPEWVNASNVAGLKGQKGEASTVKGEKGQKGEVGAQGTGGSAGNKGQKGEVGETGFLANSGKTGSYTLVAADDQKLINTNSGVTVPSGVFSAPDAVTIVNNSTGNITITQGSGVTMYFAGSSTTGNRVLAQKGIATLVCISNNNFVISGAGLS